MATERSQQCFLLDKMEIYYRLAGGPAAIGWEHRHSCATAARNDLLWSFFPGDIGIRAGGKAFETDFGWVPILHFTLSLVVIYENLSKAADAVEAYIFTEALGSIKFTRSQDLVVIEPSFRAVTVIDQMNAMRAAVKSFTERVILNLGSAHPSLLENPLTSEIVARSENL
jgi:hypothetical protein